MAMRACGHEKGLIVGLIGTPQLFRRPGANKSNVFAGLKRGAYRGWPVATHLNDGQAVEGDTVVRRLNFGSFVPLAVERRAQTAVAARIRDAGR